MEGEVSSLIVLQFPYNDVRKLSSKPHSTSIYVSKASGDSHDAMWQNMNREIIFLIDPSYEEISGCYTQEIIHFVESHE